MRALAFAAGAALAQDGYVVATEHHAGAPVLV
jgi:hypothetical protein